MEKRGSNVLLSHDLTSPGKRRGEEKRGGVCVKDLRAKSPSTCRLPRFVLLLLHLQTAQRIVVAITAIRQYKMVGSKLLLPLPRSSSFLLVVFLIIGLHHTVSGFQSSSGNNNCHRQQKISLQARKHILYTQQQNAYQRISNNNGTSALLSSSDVSSPSDDDDELSLQKKFQEHIKNMLNVNSHQKVLAAYDELLTMSTMYKKSKAQKPPRHWNT